MTTGRVEHDALVRQALQSLLEARKAITHAEVALREADAGVRDSWVKPREVERSAKGAVSWMFQTQAWCGDALQLLAEAGFEVKAPPNI